MATLALSTPTQVALFNDELMGQLSDGAWENASPSDHWEAWADATVRLAVNGNVGRDFYVRKDAYAFAKQLIDVVGDRMIAIGKRFDADYDEKKLRADLAAISKAMKAVTTFGEDEFAQVASDAQDANDTADLEAEIDLGPVVDADGAPTEQTLAVLGDGTPVADRVCHKADCDAVIVTKSANLCPTHQAEWRAARKAAKAAK